MGIRAWAFPFSLVIGNWLLNIPIFYAHHLSGGFGHDRAGLVEQPGFGEEEAAFLRGNAAAAAERLSGLDRFAIADGHLRGDAVAAGCGAGPGKEFVKNGRDNAAVGDALPAGEVFGQDVVEADAVGRLSDVEPETLRVVFSTGEAAAGILQHEESDRSEFRVQKSECRIADSDKSELRVQKSECRTAEPHGLEARIQTSEFRASGISEF
jgi:hypothetical protein